MDCHFRDLPFSLSLIVPRNSGNRANLEMTVHKKLLINKKFTTKFDDLVLL